MNTFELTIEKLVWRGRGLGRLADGRVVMVEPGTLPGERILAETTGAKRDLIHARPAAVLEPSPLRREHPCALSEDCGGCRFGMTPARNQLGLKLDILLDSLHRSLPPSFRPNPELIRLRSGSKNWRYRWRAQVHVQSGRPHYRRLLGSDLIPIQDCLLLARPLARQLALLSRSLPDGRFTLAASPEDNVSGSERESTLLTLPFPASGLRMQLPPGCFFQANWETNQILIDLITNQFPGMDRIADLYAGAGNFAIPLAGQGKEVLAVESDSRATRWGKRAALEQSLSDLEFANLDLRRPNSWERIRTFNPQGLIIDPPRSGDRHLARRLASLPELDTLVWVSCDVVNTCRDIRPLLESGWSIHDLVLVDMFPQTWHMEVVFVCKKS